MKLIRADYLLWHVNDEFYKIVNGTHHHWFSYVTEFDIRGAHCVTSTRRPIEGGVCFHSVFFLSAFLRYLLSPFIVRPLSDVQGDSFPISTNSFGLICPSVRETAIWSRVKIHREIFTLKKQIKMDVWHSLRCVDNHKKYRRYSPKVRRFCTPHLFTRTHVQ